ncbi:MAG TPA: trehalose-phosphatase [Thermoanaerobaculia bacterium]|nr:trehalose-phosphatase [Thermoanaerobaculia bacterium]
MHRLRPSALERWDEIERRFAGRCPAVFLDYDGTLAPIAPRPELATLPEPTREVLRRLARRGPVAILSGRGREDVAALVGLDELTYAGSHGFDIAGPAVRREVGEGIPERIEQASERLRRRLSGVEGVLVEPKRFAVAVHFRLADPADLPRIEAAVDAVQAELPDLRKVHGKKIFELRPDLDWDKGRALLWLLDTLHLETADGDVIPLYLGDDVTDEDAFRAVADRGIGILVAEEPRETAAAYSLRNADEVRAFLERLALRGRNVSKQV